MIDAITAAQTTQNPRNSSLSDASGTSNTAMQMDDEQYEERSRLAKEDLEQYVRTLDEYADEYQKLLNQE